MPRPTPWLAIIVVTTGLTALAPWDAGAQPRPPAQVRPPTFCRAPEALNLFAQAVRQVLKARNQDAGWPVFQVPCDPLSSVSDASATAVLIVDRAFASDQDVLQYGFTPFPFFEATAAAPRPDDPFARLGRWILQPTLTAVPSIWTRGTLDHARTESLRLAVAAGAIQALAGLANALCSPAEASVAGQLLAAAADQTRNVPDFHLYFKAALQEHRLIAGRLASLPPLAKAVAEDLSRVVVPRLQCDIGNRDRFSLLSGGAGVTSLTKTAEHIHRVLSGVKENGRGDLGQLNLARTCALQAVTDMLRSNRAPACDAADYGLWTRAYAPLLHAAEVKVLETSR